MDDPRGIEAQARYAERLRTEKEIGLLELKKKPFVKHPDPVEHGTRDHQAGTVGEIKRVKVRLALKCRAGGILGGVKLDTIPRIAVIDGGVQQAVSNLIERAEQGRERADGSQRVVVQQAGGPCAARSCPRDPDIIAAGPTLIGRQGDRVDTRKLAAQRVCRPRPGAIIDDQNPPVGRQTGRQRGEAGAGIGDVAVMQDDNDER